MNFIKQIFFFFVLFSLQVTLCSTDSIVEAVRNKQYGVVTVLLLSKKRNSIDQLKNTVCDQFGCTPLIDAIIIGDFAMVDRILKIVPKIVNIADNVGNLPIHWAVKYNNMQILKKLMELNDINAQTAFGRTPLHQAIAFRNIEAVKVLLSDSKCRINELNHEGQSPLFKLQSLVNFQETPSDQRLELKNELERARFEGWEAYIKKYFEYKNDKKQVEKLENLPNMSDLLASQDRSTSLEEELIELLSNHGALPSFCSQTRNNHALSS